MKSVATLSKAFMRVDRNLKASIVDINPKLSTTIAVVGCGNIGSRLLQSLAKVSAKSFGCLNIHGIEPCEASQKVSTQRFFDENSNGHNLMMHSDWAKVPSKIDLLIVSVDARNRLAALTSALEHASVKHTLLEKTLFIKKCEFDQADKLLKLANTTTWVNCSRNVWPGYNWLKKEIMAHGPLTNFRVTGSDWNMASNSIHFLSALEFISGKIISEISFEPENIKVRKAKRKGYYELTGKMEGYLSNGMKFEFQSRIEKGQAIIINASLGQRIYKIHESSEIVTISPNKEMPFGMLHASQLNEMFETILSKATCSLPNYSQSTRLHMLLFKALKEHIGQDTNEGFVYPIT